jgi:hypothetical protein
VKTVSSNKCEMSHVRCGVLVGDHLRDLDHMQPTAEDRRL